MMLNFFFFFGVLFGHWFIFFFEVFASDNILNWKLCFEQYSQDCWPQKKKTAESSLLFFVIYLFLLCCMACGILVPWPGIKPMPPTMEMWTLNFWIPREVPGLIEIILIFISTAFNSIYSQPWHDILSQSFILVHVYRGKCVLRGCVGGTLCIVKCLAPSLACTN